MSLSVKPHETPQESLTRITREDLTALTVAYRKATRRTGVLASGGIVGGLAFGVLLMTLRAGFNWDARLDPVFFGTGWAIALTSTAIAWRRAKRELATYQFACPACHSSLLALNPWVRQPEVSRAELAVTTGACPDCGADIYEQPNAGGPPPP